jgi:hypothetical protein
MKPFAKAVLVLFLALLALPAHADAGQKAAKPSLMTRLGHRMGKSALKHQEGGERLWNKGEMAQGSTNSVLRVAGKAMMFGGALRIGYGLLKGAFAEGFAGAKGNTYSWTKD